MTEPEPAVSNAVAVYPGDIKAVPFGGGSLLLEIRHHETGQLLT